MNFTNSQYGEIERRIIDVVRCCVEQQANDRTYLLYLTTFFNHEKFMHIKNSFADVILLFNGTDAIDPELHWIMKTPAWRELLIDKDVYFIGSDFADQIGCDFWAAVTDQYFKRYTDTEVLPTNITRVFLNYNRKPTYYRRMVLEEYINQGVDHLGHVTLGLNTFKNPDLDRFVLPPETLGYIAGGEGDAPVGDHHTLRDLRVANDIFSLGNLDVWNSCFLNVVTETSVSGTLWTSEKVFKPMIGLRPFFYYGNPAVLLKLEELGFDIFRDINLYTDKWFTAVKCSSYHADGSELEFITNHLIDLIKHLAQQDLNKLYQEILPRLKHNRELFLKYSASALAVFESNLNDHLRAN